MGNNKYYIPTLEEFHVGFAYEVYDGLREWLDAVHTPEYKLKDIESALKTGTIRVRYLNKEAIKKEGFKYKGVIDVYSESIDVYQTANELVWIYLEFYGCNPMMTYNPLRVKIKANRHHQVEDRVVFDGDIKNVNELKRILAQLDI